MDPRRAMAAPFMLDTIQAIHLPPTLASIAPALGAAAGGLAVTLTGTRYTAPNASPTTVTIGGVAATSIVVVNATTITAATPAGTQGTDVNVVVTNHWGSATLAAGFHYNQAVPDLVSLNPASGSLLGGTSVTLAGTAFTGATSVAFGGQAATSLVVVNDTTITCATPAVNVGQVDVVVTTPFGSDTLVNGYEFTL